MKYFFIKTFGCQANKSDSERIAGDYIARGFKETFNWKKANEIVVNTCSVRQRAEDRVKGFLLNTEKYFGNNRPKTILTGCMLHHKKKNLLKLLPQIDQILPINKVGFNSPAIRKDKLHAFVPISSGCNSFCTYCIVPYSRGREISRSVKDIISEVKDLINNGYREITLLGQNVNSYGLEKTNIKTRKSTSIKPKSSPPFVNLLQEISKFKGLKTINFLTANPWDFHPALIKEITQNRKINRFIHLPVQSGSNRILKLMNRGYTAQNYIKLINQIKVAVPNATFGTDIIVGFPGETEKDFQDTIDLAKKAGFQVAFIAQYSPRPGTVAYRLYQDNIPPQIKKKRWQILENLINKPHLSTRPTIR
ncbi:MiaB/RimO family radical SAM methylthiotransferase [Patescibacteria group bacterium]|nr:MiaB/RimO family radical SAM methylthiotransferase [Patescibacteria group bacterium]